MVAKGLSVLVSCPNRKLCDVRGYQIPARRRPTLMRDVVVRMLKDVVIMMRKSRGKIEKKG